MTPVDVLRLSPVGSVGLIEYDVIGPPVLVGVSEDIAAPRDSVRAELG